MSYLISACRLIHLKLMKKIKLCVRNADLHNDIEYFLIYAVTF